ncbi:MAG: histidine kinase, partial [Bacteroidota bacterium]
VGFTILQPFWQKWWFLAAATATAALIIFLIVRVRLRQLANERQRLQMEKGLLELEQKALRLQMNPHFIFNALNSIQGQIHKKDEKTARYFLAKFSKLMRAILENSRSAAIPLEQEVQTLENYLSLEQFSRGNTFEFAVDLSPSVDPEAIRIPPMMIQPFIENAIIHGVGHLTEQGRINVHFERQNGHLACTVTDNGIGRDRAAAINSQLDHHHKSTALVVTQERLDRLQNGNQTVHSLEIEDLKNAQGAPAGTRVLLRIPLVETEA